MPVTNYINKLMEEIFCELMLLMRNVLSYTCLCNCSSRNFSAFADSYSPFSKYLWSGLNLESVGGNCFIKPGVISFSDIANGVRLYLVLVTDLSLSQSRIASVIGSWPFGFVSGSPIT